MIAGLLAAFACFVLFLIGHVALFHLSATTKRFQVMAATWFVLLAAYGLLDAVFLHCLPARFVSADPVTSLPGLVGMLNGAVVYLLLFFAYCCLYFTDHSLTVAYMIELEDRPGKAMTLAELKKRFPHEEMLRHRFADLIANSYVVQEGEYYRLAPKGKLFAGTLGTIKRMLKLEPGG